jgi:hypothetical protein
MRFSSGRPEIKRTWVSLFAPQQEAERPEILTPALRRPLYPKFPKQHRRCGAIVRPGFFLNMKKN